MVIYYLRKFACVFFAMLLGASIIVLTISASTVALMKNGSYLENKIELSKAEVVSELQDEFEKLNDLTGIPAEVYSNAFENGGFDVLSETAVRALQYGYDIDFSSSKELYNVFASAVSDYSTGNSLDMTSDEISRNASLAVDTVNRDLKSSTGRQERIFSIIRNNLLLVLSIAISVALGAISVVVIAKINKGRHRMYNYIGMGIATGGYILFFVPFVLNFSEKVESFAFSEYAPYNSLIRDFVHQELNIYTALGVVMLVTGLVMLGLNYRYYADKKAIVKQEKEIDKTRITEFLGEEPPKRRVRAEGEEFEKEVTKIDFD